MNQPPVNPRLTFDYVKSSLFRTIHADGVVGSITPASNIYIAFFNERFAIPQQLVFEIQPDGEIGDEILESRRSRDSVLREMEVGVTMSIDAAEFLLESLQEIIKEAKEQI